MDFAQSGVCDARPLTVRGYRRHRGLEQGFEAEGSLRSSPNRTDTASIAVHENLSLHPMMQITRSLTLIPTVFRDAAKMTNFRPYQRLARSSKLRRLGRQTDSSVSRFLGGVGEVFEVDR